MKTIGLLGGMSWESSLVYYRLVNEHVRDTLGGLHSADCLLRSVDFAPIAEMQRRGEWDAAGRALAQEAVALVNGGAELIALCTNTMHKVAEAVESALTVPFLHIGDATGVAIRAAGYERVGLLATGYTMEQDFYVGRMRDRHGIDVLVPDAPARAAVHRVIYEELVLGQILDLSRAEYQRIIADLVHRGAQAVVLGCTEIDLLIGPADVDVPLFDSTALHARAAVDLSLERTGVARGVG